MVNSGDGPIQTERICKYDIATVKSLVREELVHFAGTRINSHLSKMGFTEVDVIDAIQCLTEANYEISHLYEGASWTDIYLLTYTGKCGNTFDLYIKFRMTPSQKLVIVCSFHPEGWE